MIGDPASAPPRRDLTFLRRRSRPRAAIPVRHGAPASLGTTDSSLADFIHGRAKHPSRRQPQAPAVGPISFARPDRSSGGLDLSRPAGPGSASAPPPSAAPVPSTSLDLDPQPAAPSGPSRGALDLSGTAGPRPVARSTGHAARRLRGDRVRAGNHHLLSIKDPTVVLTRLQSGIGQLEIEAVCSPDVGDLRLGAAYQLRSGATSTVQLAGGNRFAPSSRRPVIVSGRDEYDHLRVDLRQVRDLERMAVYAFSESRAELAWGGTLVVTTSGAARIELPLETLYAGRIAVLISIYNLEGELVIRAEMETIVGDIREAARAYGYDRITWRDDRSPID